MVGLHLLAIRRRQARRQKKGAPARLWGIDPYIEPGTERFDGIDYDAFNGSIYGLRGLADLGHTAPHVAGNRESIAYTAPDGNLLS